MSKKQPLLRDMTLDAMLDRLVAEKRIASKPPIDDQGIVATNGGPIDIVEIFDLYRRTRADNATIVSFFRLLAEGKRLENTPMPKALPTPKHLAVN